MLRVLGTTLAIVLVTLSAGAAEFKTLSFDEASDGMLIRSLPLKISVPTKYELVPNQPEFGIQMWTTPASHDHLKQHGFASPDEGVIQIRVTPNVAYVRASDSFACGPDCDQDDLIEQFKAAGATDLKTERFRVNGVPMWIVEAKMPPMAGFGSSKIYMAYIAALVDTNVVLLSFTPSTTDAVGGELVWLTLKKTPISSGK